MYAYDKHMFLKLNIKTPTQERYAFLLRPFLLSIYAVQKQYLQLQNFTQHQKN